MDANLDLAGWRRCLRCPECRAGALLTPSGVDQVKCPVCASRFPIVAGRLVLLRRDNELFKDSDYTQAAVEARSPERAGSLLGRFLPSPSINLSQLRVLKQLVQLLDARGPSDVLIIGGGRQRSWLDPILLANVAHRVCYVDIDVGANVEVFCDAHELPFADAAFDGVITTAVLEHVMYPEQAAAEMARVLRPGGLIYSELPFMQQVHEGAYDFTRYTLSGHRRLLSAFSELDAGMVAGPGTALVWAIENFALALFPRALRSVTKAGARVIFGWLKYADVLLKNRPRAMDGASCTYFFGRRYDGTGRTTDSQIIAGYRGGIRLTHT